MTAHCIHNHFSVIQQWTSTAACGRPVRGEVIWVARLSCPEDQFVVSLGVLDDGVHPRIDYFWPRRDDGRDIIPRACPPVEGTLWWRGEVVCNSQQNYGKNSRRYRGVAAGGAAPLLRNPDVQSRMREEGGEWKGMFH